jgi:hypothetical protein
MLIREKLIRENLIRENVDTGEVDTVILIYWVSLRRSSVPSAVFTTEVGVIMIY